MQLSGYEYGCFVHLEHNHPMVTGSVIKDDNSSLTSSSGEDFLEELTHIHDELFYSSCCYTIARHDYDAINVNILPRFSTTTFPLSSSRLHSAAPDLTTVMSNKNIASFMLLPVLTKEAIIGVFLFLHSSTLYISPSVAAYCEILARAVGVSLRSS
jgi:light-regulated signal transduction histidine kinase (bacteriophytochrome)